jgi:hypothetical protein
MRLLFFFIAPLFANVFDSLSLEVFDSPKLLERLAQKDSLLPSFDGEKSLNRLMAENPQFWQVERLGPANQIKTKLTVKIVFIDGIQEEAYCYVDTLLSHEKKWELEIGLDFLSGASNVVATHVAQCLDLAVEQLGISYWDGTKMVEQAPRVIEEGFSIYRVNPKLSNPDKKKVLRITQEVESSGKCPAKVKDYAFLNSLYKKIDSLQMDLIRMQTDLSSDTLLFSCSWSQEWNSFITDSMRVECDIQAETCETFSESEGRMDWMLHSTHDILEYQAAKLLGIPLGVQSIHDGGKVLDMRLLPMSKGLYLEVYLDLNKNPVSLGWLMRIKKEKKTSVSQK